MPSCSWSANLVTSEYRLKAALIYKLTRFVEWPEGEFDHDAFDVCLLGHDSFGGALDALEGRKVRSLRIRIRRFVQSESVSASCRILFISDSKRPFLENILNALSHRPTLTIGDMRGFAEKGGIIEFVQEGKRLGFKINLAQANAAGLRLAAPLLELATIVKTEQP